MREVGSWSWERQEWGPRVSLSHGKGGSGAGRGGRMPGTQLGRGERDRENAGEGTGERGNSREFIGIPLDPCSDPRDPLGPCFGKRQEWKTGGTRKVGRSGGPKVKEMGGSGVWEKRDARKGGAGGSQSSDGGVGVSRCPEMEIQGCPSGQEWGFAGGSLPWRFVVQRDPERQEWEIRWVPVPDKGVQGGPAARK